jgi:long-chain fatty acid transport protein
MNSGNLIGRRWPGRAMVGIALIASITCEAGGGYNLLGYGPLAHQAGGTSTAMGLDGFAGASNPAKLAFVGDRLDLDLLLFSPYRKIRRTGTGTPYDFSSTSKNSFFLLPEAGYAHKIDERWSVGLALYGNGGLNTEFRDDTGVPGTNANPARCGDAPGNFLLGCGKLGFDLAQVIVAPTVSWQYTPGQSVGFSALIGYQRIKVYGFQAFENLSAHPDAVSNRGYDGSFGTGARIGWFARPFTWLDVGAAYTTRMYFDEFDRYRGLLADEGNFDIPQSVSFGTAIRPSKNWELGFDLHRTFWGDIRSLHNGVLNSLQDPQNKPLGSKDGSGFNWVDRNSYRAGVAYAATQRLTLRAGATYGRRPSADSSANSITFGLFAPNPLWQVTAGGTWKVDARNQVHLAIGHYVRKKFQGPSASESLGLGGEETGAPHVETLMLGWSRTW